MFCQPFVEECKQVKNKKNMPWILYIFLFDFCILPTFHIFGLPFKVSYLIGFVWLLYFALFDRANPLRKSKEGLRVVGCFLGIIIVTTLGELTSFFVAGTDFDYYIKQLFFFIVLISCVVLAYNYHYFNKGYFVFLLIVFCLVNILFGALGSKIPSFFIKLYISNNDSSVLDYNRINGTLGNPNATLCLMNMIFMAIIVFIRKGEIHVGASWKMIVLIILPILTNAFINSRGEFLVTAFLEVVFIFSVFQKVKSIRKIIWVVTLAVVFIVGYNILFGYLATQYKTVSFSLSRIMGLFEENYTTVYETGTDSFSERPFIHLDEFFDRFMFSPIWGSGFDVGPGVLTRSTTAYHNDWFQMFASGGLIGGLLWVCLFVFAARKCGLFYLVPLFVTAISNSFINSPFALGVFFITSICCLRKQELNPKKNRNSLTNKIDFHINHNVVNARTEL